MNYLTIIEEAQLFARKSEWCRLRWLRKLDQREQIYLEKKTTLKHTTLFASLCAVKGVHFQNDQDYEVAMAKYLQLIMVLYSYGDEEFEQVEFVEYGRVPFHLEKIAQNLNPYRMEHDYHDYFKSLITKYRIHDFYDSAADRTAEWKHKYAKSHKGIMDQVMDYYSYPIFAFALYQKPKVVTFEFNEEMKIFFRYMLAKYDKQTTKRNDSQTELYYQSMRLVAQGIDKKIRKFA